MTKNHKVQPELRPRDLNGISEDQLAQHWALYEGYVANVNLLEGKIHALTKKGDFGAEFSELKRRAGFEYNGMVLHEHYFGILKAGGHPLNESTEFAKKLGESFGGIEDWRKEFAAMGHMRGSGWVILYHEPRRDILTNIWISSHEDGHPAGFTPLLVMDVWEHAYMVDWGAGGRADYVEKFLLNVDWAKLEDAYRAAAQTAAV
jgi:Fe-Mn family superoxide dismutase